MTLVARFASTIAQLRLSPGRAIVAVSGGIDSVVLLDLLARSRAQHGLDLVVAHLDHGIQPGAAPRAIVERLSARHGIPVQVRELHLPPDATETEARHARLAALESIADAEEGRVIFLAHHADDQAETVLMRLLNGSGPAGLRGMALRRDRLVRPLLACAREELRAHARAAGLEWWDDPANQDSRHLRSWLRQEIIPRIQARLPDLQARLLQAAEHARRDRSGWVQVLRHWPALDWNRRAAAPVSLPVVAAMPPAMRGAVLATFVREAGCPAGPARIAAAWSDLEGTTSGAYADLSGGWRFETAFGRLRILAPVLESTLEEIPLTGRAGELTWGDWELAWRTEAAPEVQLRLAEVAWFVPAPLFVRRPRPGDRLDPLGGVGRRLVVRCFQEAQVPHSIRAGWPVIECASGIAWVPSVCRSGQLLPAPGTSSLRLEVSVRV